MVGIEFRYRVFWVRRMPNRGHFESRQPSQIVAVHMTDVTMVAPTPSTAGRRTCVLKLSGNSR